MSESARVGLWSFLVSATIAVEKARAKVKAAKIAAFIAANELTYSVEELWNEELDAERLKWLSARNLPANARRDARRE